MKIRSFNYFLFIFLFLNNFIIKSQACSGNQVLLPVAGKFDLFLNTGFGTSETDYEVSFSTFKYDFQNNTWDFTKLVETKSKINFKNEEYVSSFALSRLIFNKLVLNLSVGIGNIYRQNSGSDLYFTNTGIFFKPGIGFRYFILEDYPLSPALSFFVDYGNSNIELKEKRTNLKAKLLVNDLNFGITLGRKIKDKNHISGGIIVKNKFSSLNFQNKDYEGQSSSGLLEFSFGRKIIEDFYLFFDLNIYNTYYISLNLVKKFEF